MSRRTARRIAALLSALAIIAGGTATTVVVDEGPALANGCCH